MQLMRPFQLFYLKTLGKCAKMMPVMVWGIIIMRKRWVPELCQLCHHLCLSAYIYIYIWGGKSATQSKGDLGMVNGFTHHHHVQTVDGGPLICEGHRFYA